MATASDMQARYDAEMRQAKPKARARTAPHVRIRRGFSRAGFIARIGGPIPWAAYCVLLDCRNDRTAIAYPGVESIAEQIGACRRAVQRALRRLEDAGAIVATGSKKGGKAKSVHYTVMEWQQTAHHVRPLTGQTAHEMTLNRAPHAPERTEERGGRIGWTPTAAGNGQ